MGSLDAGIKGVEGEITLLMSGRRGKWFSKEDGDNSCGGSATFCFSTVGSTILKWVVSLLARCAKLNVGIVLDGIPMESRLQLNSWVGFPGMLCSFSCCFDLYFRRSDFSLFLAGTFSTSLDNKFLSVTSS